jgi:hypothetical protein
MTLAMKKLKNFGWLALLSIVAVLLYPLSLNVGALHNELKRTDRKIMETKREISFLQAELRTRANMQQLAEWNDVLYGYEPPTAQQFVDGERALANLDGAGPVVKPVMVAVSNVDGTAPAGEIGRAGAAASKIDIPKTEQSGAEKPSRVAIAAPDNIQAKPKANSISSTAASTRTERLSRIDDQLLSDNLLKEIDKKAAQERKRR